MRDWNRGIRGAMVALLLCSAVLLLSGCGDPQEEALRELDRRDLDFTVSDFVVSAGKGDLAAVQIYVAAGMGVESPEDRGMTAVLKAAESGRVDVVEWLIESGADVNGKGAQGRTPLIGAAQGGHTEVIRLLLSRGADPLSVDDDDWSALTLGAYRGHAEVASLLAPRSIELLDDALLVAAFEGNPEVIDSLLNNGAYVNTRSPNSQTALMIASMNGRFDAVKLLVHNGANRYALDDLEMTAGNLAMENGHREVGDFLNQPPDMGTSTVGRAEIPESWLPPDFDPAELDGRDLGGDSRIGTLAGPTGAEPGRVDGVQIRPVAVERGEIAAAFEMQEYREDSLPVILKEVGTEEAEVRVLYREGDPVVVREGEEIADTGLQVVSFGQRFANSKYGKGSLVDVSQMVVADRETGAKHLLVKGIPAVSSETFALMRLDESGRSYDVRTQDEFTAKGAGFEDHFRVLDVRPNQVVIQNTDTRESFTIPRVAAAGKFR